MPLPTLPNATTPGEVAPAWYAEPAKKVGTVIGAIAGGVTVVVAAVTSISDLLPEKVRTEVAAGTLIAGTVVVGLTRVQAVLTRDRVWAPESIKKTFGDPEYGGGNDGYPYMPPLEPTGEPTTEPTPEG